MVRPVRGPGKGSRGSRLYARYFSRTATRDGGVMAEGELQATAKALVAEGKGILAADESDGTIKKRFDSIGVESTEENRRADRENHFRTERAAERINGVILYDETTRQRAADGTP